MSAFCIVLAIGKLYLIQSAPLHDCTHVLGRRVVDVSVRVKETVTDGLVVGVYAGVPILGWMPLALPSSRLLGGSTAPCSLFPTDCTSLSLASG